MIDAAMRKLVTDRARSRCEYCQIHQESESFYRFHVEHVVARQHGGSNRSDNLALACHHCNSHKGPNLSAIVPGSNSVVRLFNPRRQSWPRHFEAINGVLGGRTRIGKATIQLLRMNAVARVALRLEVNQSSADPQM